MSRPIEDTASRTKETTTLFMIANQGVPVNNMIKLFRRSLDRYNISRGRPPVIKDPLAD
jgi:hypothetical protein